MNTHRIIPKKSLGQNFLVDQRIRRKIVDASLLHPADTILEIGPGKGFLTEAIAPHVQKIIAIEKDSALVRILREKFQENNVEIIEADILDFPLESLPPNLKIVSNLPYNIATAIIQKCLSRRGQFHSFFMTIQWEYAQRMTARPRCKDYSSFSCFVQYYADVKKLFKIKRTCFSPVPNVDSCFAHLTVLPKPRRPALNETFLFHLIRRAFTQRRKTLVNALAEMSAKDELTGILKHLSLNPKGRAEDLCLEDFVRLADILWEKKGNSRGQDLASL